MRTERGFRRITLVLSLGVFLAGLVMTGYAINYHQEYQRRYERWSAAESNCTKAQAKAQTRAQTKAPTHVTDEEAIRLIACHLARQLGPMMPPRTPQEQATLIGLIVSATVALALVPWGVFYLVRWVARGFAP